MPGCSDCPHFRKELPFRENWHRHGQLLPTIDAILKRRNVHIRCGMWKLRAQVRLIKSERKQKYQEEMKVLVFFHQNQEASCCSVEREGSARGVGSSWLESSSPPDQGRPPPCPPPPPSPGLLFCFPLTSHGCNIKCTPSLLTSWAFCVAPYSVSKEPITTLAFEPFFPPTADFLRELHDSPCLNRRRAAIVSIFYIWTLKNSALIHTDMWGLNTYLPSLRIRHLT